MKLDNVCLDNVCLEIKHCIEIRRTALKTQPKAHFFRDSKDTERKATACLSP